VEAVGKLDNQHPNVAAHREDHLPEVLCLPLFTGLEPHLADLGDPVDKGRDLLAEVPFQIFKGG
jgi:hypothetical protein